LVNGSDYGRDDGCGDDFDDGSLIGLEGGTDEIADDGTLVWVLDEVFVVAVV
jgi:hypothetical protein